METHQKTRGARTGRSVISRRHSPGVRRSPDPEKISPGSIVPKRHEKPLNCDFSGPRTEGHWFDTWLPSPLFSFLDELYSIPHVFVQTVGLISGQLYQNTCGGVAQWKSLVEAVPHSGLPSHTLSERYRARTHEKFNEACVSRVTGSVPDSPPHFFSFLGFAPSDYGYRLCRDSRR
jgi:hypothetical protein